MGSGRADTGADTCIEKKDRGYNQAEVFAEAVGSALDIPVLSDWISRCRKTVPQKELGQAERQNNLKKAFKIIRNDVKLNTIVIIDDIYTTGSTIDAVAECARAAGVQKVYFVALAIGKGM
jgi:ComF family protein